MEHGIVNGVKNILYLKHVENYKNIIKKFIILDHIVKMELPGIKD